MVQAKITSCIFPADWRLQLQGARDDEFAVIYGFMLTFFIVILVKYILKYTS